MKEKTELQKEIDGAYQILASIPVSGDFVEVMAAARQKLRSAYSLAKHSEGACKDG